MIGKQVGHYKVVEKLGEGGMGVVYRAHDTRLGRDVALKFLPPAAGQNAEDRERFVGEARAAAALDHPNICTVYEIGEDGDQLYIAMALVEGETLRDRIDRDGAFDVLEAIKIARKVADGLAAAHERGVVHRDIKSANIMVTDRGAVKIMDFGLAHHVEGGTLQSESSGHGTIAYASPEQARGDEGDARVDVWSLGVTLYEMLAGHLPFKGGYESAITYSVLNEPPEPIENTRRDVPESIVATVLRALEKNPEDRYASAADMSAALREQHIALDPTVSKALGGAPGGAAPRNWVSHLTTRGALLTALGYLVLTAIIAVAIDVIVARMMLSPTLVTTVWVGMLSLLPAVMMTAAGIAGKGSFNKPAMIGVPVNVIASVALLFVLFSGENLGAATQTVEVTTEEGNTVERSVPKGEFVKRMALYPFENTTGDNDLDWMQFALPEAIDLDMFQDSFVSTRSSLSTSSYQRLRDGGFNSWLEAPLALKRKIASEFNQEYFLIGSIESADPGQWQLTTNLYQTKSTKLVATNTFTGPDFFGVVDAASVQLKRDMGVPQWHIDDVQDLPIGEISTGSVDAFRAFVQSESSVALDDDFEAALKFCEQAVELDSTFALAHYKLFQYYKMSNAADASRKHGDQAIQYDFKMPERFRFIVKANYYFDRREPDKAYNVLKMMAELYPQDPMSFRALAQVHHLRGEKEEAVKDLKRVLEMEPFDSGVMKRLGQLYTENGQYESALQSYAEFARLNPSNPTSFENLGGVYAATGDFQAARDNYEKALLVEPDRVETMASLAQVEFNQGNFDASLKMLNTALEKARTSERRLGVLTAMQEYYVKRGRIAKAIDVMKDRHKEIEATNPGVMANLLEMDDLGIYVKIGRLDLAQAAAKAIKDGLKGSQLDIAAPSADLVVYLEADDPEKAEPGLEGMQRYISAWNLEMVRPDYLRAKGRIEELRGDLADALASYKEAIELRPHFPPAHLGAGRALRTAGKLKEAEAELLSAVKTDPYDAETNHELALLYDAMDDRRMARSYLDRALDVIDGADPDFVLGKQIHETEKAFGPAPNP